MWQSVEDRLAKLPPDLQPLAAAVRLHCSRGVSVQADGAVQVGAMPWVGPEAFAFVLYPPARPAWLRDFGHRNGRAIPDYYGTVLTALNGCFAFGLALYGLPPSLQEGAPHLDDRTLQPLDLDAANRYWAREYRGAEGEFHIGGRTWTPTESVGYFVASTGQWRSRRTEGEVLREWPSLRDLLAEELPAVEAWDRERRARKVWPWESRHGDA